VRRYRLLIAGEGEHELGAKPRSCRGDDWALDASDLPALPRLVQRLLADPCDVDLFARKLVKKFPHIQKNLKGVAPGKLSGHAKKLFWTLRAVARKHDAAAYLIDRDGPKNAGTLAALREGRSAFEEVHGTFPCAVGAAVETFDAWMICDRDAIGAAGGDPAKANEKPELLQGGPRCRKHPKRIAGGIFRTRRGSGLGPKYKVVAQQVNLALLERACPQGFKPFAKEVRERIGPVVSGG